MGLLRDDFQLLADSALLGGEPALGIEHVMDHFRSRWESPQVALDGFGHGIEQAPGSLATLSELRMPWLAPFPEETGDVGHIDRVLVIESKTGSIPVRATNLRYYLFSYPLRNERDNRFSEVRIMVSSLE